MLLNRNVAVHFDAYVVRFGGSAEFKRAVGVCDNRLPSVDVGKSDHRALSVYGFTVTVKLYGTRIRIAFGRNVLFFKGNLDIKLDIADRIENKLVGHDLVGHVCAVDLNERKLVALIGDK